MLYPQKYIAWDLETSGLDPATNKILEIGAIKFENGNIIEQKSWLLNHGIPIPKVITEITTLTKAQIDAEGVDPKSAIDEFLEWLEPMGWVNLTHNGFKFDIPFLLEALTTDNTFDHSERETIKELLYRNGVDSAVLYKGKHLPLERNWNENFAQYAARVLDTKAFGVKYNIAHCCKELGIDVSSTRMHRALGDISLTHEIYQKMIA